MWSVLEFKDPFIEVHQYPLTIFLVELNRVQKLGLTEFVDDRHILDFRQDSRSASRPVQYMLFILASIFPLHMKSSERLDEITEVGGNVNFT